VKIRLLFDFASAALLSLWRAVSTFISNTLLSIV
jgi:hypothetical protein